MSAIQQARRSILLEPSIKYSVEELSKPVVQPYLKKFRPRSLLHVEGPLGKMSIPMYNGFRLEAQQMQYPASVLQNTTITLPDRQLSLKLDPRFLPKKILERTLWRQENRPKSTDVERLEPSLLTLSRRKKNALKDNATFIDGVLVRTRPVETDAHISQTEQAFSADMWTTTASLIRNAVKGVTSGHQSIVRFVGVGYRAKVENMAVLLKLGYCHWIQVPIPDGITVACPMPTKLVIQGIDLQMVRQFAFKLRKYRKPEPYNGKGVFVDDETIIRKEPRKK